MAIRTRCSVTPTRVKQAIWYLNNNVYIGCAYGPTLAAGWGLRGLAISIATAIRIMPCSLPTRIRPQSGIYLGPHSSGALTGRPFPVDGNWWRTADFNGDSKPDYVLYNSGTNQTAVWYMNNNVYAGGGYGPTLPPGWNLMGVSGF